MVSLWCCSCRPDKKWYHAVRLQPSSVMVLCDWGGSNLWTKWLLFENHAYQCYISMRRFWNQWVVRTQYAHSNHWTVKPRSKNDCVHTSVYVVVLTVILIWITMPTNVHFNLRHDCELDSKDGLKLMFIKKGLVLFIWKFSFLTLIFLSSSWICCPTYEVM